MAAIASLQNYDISNFETQREISKRKNCKTIIPELKSRGFSDEIATRAESICRKINHGVHRGEKRCMLLFFCTSNAYRELGIDVDQFELGMCFNLDKGKVKKCDSIFSPLNTGYHPVDRDITPMNYIPEFCEKLGIASEQIVTLRKIIDRTSLRNKALMQENPRTLAAGFIKYFLSIHGINVDNKTLTEITGRSLATIDNMEKRIEYADNN